MRRGYRFFDEDQVTGVERERKRRIRIRKKRKKEKKREEKREKINVSPVT